MAQLNPYLNFSNNCREAMNFYKDCLGGELMMRTVGEMPEMAAMMPPEFKDSILHASLTSGDLVFFGSDLNRDQPVEGNTIQLCINCSSDEELNNFFNKLSEGGQVLQPVGEMPWGATYAELKDKYHKTWLLNFQKVPMQ